MASLAGFDASQVPEQEDFEAIPPADYVAIATASEMKPTKNGKGQYLQVTFEVLDGAFKGRKLWARMNLVNENTKAQDIAQRELGALCRAVGVLKPNDSAELHNKPLTLTVDTELNDKGKEQNVVKKYTALNGQAPVVNTAFASAPATAPAAAPAAAAKAPWAK